MNASPPPQRALHPRPPAPDHRLLPGPSLVQVARQREALAAKKAKVGLSNDAEWSGDKFVQEANSMVAN